MNLFNYLMTKKGHNTSVRDDLFAYLLGKRTPKEVKTATGTTISISDVTSEKIVSLTLDKESTQDGTPTPENPVPVEVVEGYIKNGNNYVDVKVTGKNLYNSSYRNQNGTINGSNNTIITESDGVYSATRTDGSPLYIWSQAPSGSSYASGNGTLVEVETGVTYAVTITNSLFNNNFLVTYDENKVSTGFVNRGNSFTFTPNGSTKYISLRIGMTNSEANVTYSTSVQVEKGSATEYEPYKESIVTIPLNNNEIAGIGDYKDELIVDSNGHCWLNKKTGKVVLDGSGIATNITERDITTRAYIGKYDERMPNSFLSRGCLSNLLIQKNIYNDDIEGFYFAYSGKWVIIAVNKNIIGTTLESIKAYLDNNNFIAYYPLETPELIDLNYTVEIRLFNGVNNISNSDDMDMTLKYY